MHLVLDHHPKFIVLQKYFFMCDCKNIKSCKFSNPFQLSTLLENMLVLHAPTVMIIFHHNVAFFH